MFKGSCSHSRLGLVLRFVLRADDLSNRVYVSNYTRNSSAASMRGSKKLRGSYLLAVNDHPVFTLKDATAES